MVQPAPWQLLGSSCPAGASAAIRAGLAECADGDGNLVRDVLTLCRRLDAGWRFPMSTSDKVLAAILAALALILASCETTRVHVSLSHSLASETGQTVESTVNIDL